MPTAAATLALALASGPASRADTAVVYTLHGALLVDPFRGSLVLTGEEHDAFAAALPHPGVLPRGLAAHYFDACPLDRQGRPILPRAVDSERVRILRDLHKRFGSLGKTDVAARQLFLRDDHVGYLQGVLRGVYGLPTGPPSIDAPLDLVALGL